MLEPLLFPQPIRQGNWGSSEASVSSSSGYRSCILAYSGIESVVQTAGLVRTWKDIAKAYWFLALTIGIFTPLITVLVLSSGIDPSLHETDLLTQFAAKINGIPFGMTVAVTASVALIMAVNTAFVASSELIERVAHRYNFSWIIKTNARQSLYRVHILNAMFYSFIIVLTGGSQRILAEMYALGLVASFTHQHGELADLSLFDRDERNPRVSTLPVWGR